MEENKDLEQNEEVNEENSESALDENPNKEYEDKIEELEKKNYDLNDKY